MAFEQFFSKKTSTIKVPRPPKEGGGFLTKKIEEDSNPITDFRKSAISKGKKELYEREVSPIYLKVHHFKAMSDQIEQIRTRLGESDNVINRLIEREDNEDKTFRRWQSQVKELHEKFIFVDELLFRGR